jgi:hypothetical protein
MTPTPRLAFVTAAGRWARALNALPVLNVFDKFTRGKSPPANPDFA